MTFDEFEIAVTEIYYTLPEEIQSRFAINLEQYPEEGSINSRAFGYWHSLTPNCVTLCYWVFRLHGDFSKGHIERVVKHEFEHTLQGTTHSPGKHSEHK